MKRSVGQGVRVQIDVRLNDEPITSIIYGAASGHPYFREGIPNGANLQAEMVSLFASSALSYATVLTPQNLEAILEFIDHLAEEAMGDAGDFDWEAPGDQVSFGEFPF